MPWKLRNSAYLVNFGSLNLTDRGKSLQVVKAIFVLETESGRQTDLLQIRVIRLSERYDKRNAVNCVCRVYNYMVRNIFTCNRLYSRNQLHYTQRDKIAQVFSVIATSLLEWFMCFTLEQSVCTARRL